MRVRVGEVILRLGGEFTPPPPAPTPRSRRRWQAPVVDVVVVSVDFAPPGVGGGDARAVDGVVEPPKPILDFVQLRLDGDLAIEERRALRPQSVPLMNMAAALAVR